MPPQHEHIDMTVDVDEAMNDCYNRLVLTTVLSILFSSTFHIAAFILSRSNEIYLRSPSSNSLGACQVSTLFASAKRDNQDDENLERDIDAFLGGEYDRPFAPDAPTPHPGLSPRATIEAVLSSLREPNKPEPSHGAAVLQRFCAPLSRGERWGGGSVQNDPWKEVLRGAITPTMLLRRLRASVFSVLLDYTKVDVTDGYAMAKGGVPSISFVNAALFFGRGMEPCLVQFTLRRYGGVWLIDTAQVSKKELFVQQSNETNWEND